MLPDFLSDLKYRLRALFKRGAMERELDDELRDHIEHEAVKLRAAGVAPDEAMRRARAAFGGVENVREGSRDARGVRWLEIAVQDIRTAARALRAQPTYTAIAVISLAVGISVSAGVMAMFEGVRYRALGFPNADHVVSLYNRSYQSPFGHFWNLPPASVNAIRDRATDLAGIATYWNSDVVVQTDGWATVVQAVITTPSFFSILGVRAERGRVLTASDSVAGAQAAVVLSHDFWTSRFGGDTGIVGHTIQLDRTPYVVAGIIPQDAALPSSAALWALRAPGPASADSTTSLRSIVGIRSPSALPRVNAELDAITRATGRGARDSQRHDMLGAVSLRDMLTESMLDLLVLFGIVGVFVALIASVNFATLMLARGMRRRAELGVRAALGASLPRLVSHMIAECVLVSLAGGLVGAIMAPIVVRLVNVMAPGLTPAWMQVTWGWRESTGALGLALILGVLFGLEPAFELARPAVMELMRGGSSRSTGERRLRSRRRTLVGWQVFLAVGPSAFILIGVAQSLNAGQADTGYDTTNLYAGNTLLTGRDRAAAQESQIALLNAIRRAPGVESAAISQAGILVGQLVGVDAGTGDAGAQVSDTAFHSTTLRGVTLNRVSPNYFSTVRLSVVRGRLPTPEEISAGSPVAVVASSASRQLVGHDAVGWRLKLGDVAFTVIGVVADSGSDARVGAIAPSVFTPEMAPDATRRATVFVRARPGARRLTSDVYATLRVLDPQSTVTDLESVVAHENRATSYRRRALGMIGLVFLIALGLAAVGVYGIVSYAAVTRRREIAIRVALGARRAGTALLVMREGAVQSGVGFVFGVGGGIVASHYFMTQLGAPAATVPVAPLVAIAAALVVMVVVSSIIPVRRTWRIDVAPALREDG